MGILLIRRFRWFLHIFGFEILFWVILFCFCLLQDTVYNDIRHTCHVSAEFHTNYRKHHTTPACLYVVIFSDFLEQKGGFVCVLHIWEFFCYFLLSKLKILQHLIRLLELNSWLFPLSKCPPFNPANSFVKRSKKSIKC